MVKTIRLSESTHKELVKIAGEMQAQHGKNITLDFTINELIRVYRKRQ